MKTTLDEIQWGRIRYWMEVPGNLAVLKQKSKDGQAILLGLVAVGRDPSIGRATMNTAVSNAILDEALRMWAHLASDAPEKPGLSGPVLTDPTPRKTRRA